MSKKAAERDGFRLHLGGQDLEALRLFAIKRRIFREGHHRARDGDALARGEIANQRVRLSERHADAADAGIDADVNRNRTAKPRRFAIERVADGRVDHRHDVSRYGRLQVAVVEWRHQQDWFLDPLIAQVERLLQFDDGKPVHGGRGLERPGR